MSTGRRCRRPPRQLAPGALRPSDLLAAFFGAALLFLLAAAGVAVDHAVTGWAEGHWLSLHLAFVGGVSQLVLGAGQFFAGAFLATDPPGKRLVAAQLVSWNAGAVLVAAGVPTGSHAATQAGALLLTAALVLFLAGLRGLRRRSLQHAPWAVLWYQACAIFLVAGALVGAQMAAGAAWTHGSLLGAHMTLNLAGWFGTAIVGTLHTFFPSLTQTQLRRPRLQRPAFAAWTGGVAVLAAGYAFGAGAAVIAGWALLAAAAALLAVNLAGSLRASAIVPALPARLIAAGQACLLPALLVGLGHALSGPATAAPYGAARDAMAILLVPGWLGLTVVGSLLHLLAVLGRVRDLRRPLPVARPARDRSITGLAALAVLALAGARAGIVPALRTPATAVLVGAYGTFGALVLARAGSALRPRRARTPRHARPTTASSANPSA